jgi:hypothetical protein
MKYQKPLPQPTKPQNKQSLFIRWMSKKNLNTANSTRTSINQSVKETIPENENETTKSNSITIKKNSIVPVPQNIFDASINPPNEIKHNLFPIDCSPVLPSQTVSSTVQIQMTPKETNLNK